MKTIKFTKKIIVKTLNLSLIFILLASFYSCEEFEEFGYEDDNPTEELNGNGSIIPGLYKKQVSQTAAYLKITASQGYLCRAQDNIEFSGNIVGNTIHFEVDGSIIETELRQDGNNLWARNLINNNYDEWTEYFPSNDNYPCNGGGNNNYVINGNIKFWMTRTSFMNSNYTPKTITLKQSGQADRSTTITDGISITPNFDYSQITCDVATYGGNFYNLPVGTYAIYETWGGDETFTGLHLIVQSVYHTQGDCQVYEF